MKPPIRGKGENPRPLGTKSPVAEALESPGDCDSTYRALAMRSDCVKVCPKQRPELRHHSSCVSNASTCHLLRPTVSLGYVPDRKLIVNKNLAANFQAMHFFLAGPQQHLAIDPVIARHQSIV